MSLRKVTKSAQSVPTAGRRRSNSSRRRRESSSKARVVITRPSLTNPFRFGNTWMRFEGGCLYTLANNGKYYQTTVHNNGFRLED